jgi:hypothetical protein
MRAVLQRLQSLILAVATAGVAILVYLAEQPKAAPSAQISQRPPPTPTASAKPIAPKPASLWIGDAFTAGVGAPNRAHAESCLAAKAMGWVCHVDAERGTGYLSTGHVNSPTFAPIGQRLNRDTQRFHPDVVVLDGGRTDTAFPVSAVEAAVDSELKGIRAAWPSARIVLIAPYFMTSDTEPLGAAFVAYLHTEAAAYHADVIDPVGAGWISSAKSGALRVPNQVDPSPAGHRYIAKHLAMAFRQFPKLAGVTAGQNTGA